MDSNILSGHDQIDQKIIEILNQNARTPSKEIASELRKLGNDVSDRTIRKRIERLEKSGIIKGYRAVLTDVVDTTDSQALFLKFKVEKAASAIHDTLKEFVSTLPNFMFLATMDGEWNLLVVLRMEESQKNPSSQIIEKFSEHIMEYRTSHFEIKDVNILNMSLLLL